MGIDLWLDNLSRRKDAQRREVSFERALASSESIPGKSWRSALESRNGDYSRNEPWPTLHDDSRKVPGRRGPLLEDQRTPVPNSRNHPQGRRVFVGAKNLRPCR